MNAEAQKIVESLRYGIPPDGYVRHFTVGRIFEIRSLQERLARNMQGALLLKANYGSGKSHLLNFIRETALTKNYAVSKVTLDSRSGVRFNRMEQIFGSILSNLEIPSSPSEKGIRTFYNMLREFNYGSSGISRDHWKKVSNSHWAYTNELESPAIFVTLRAWISGRSNEDLIESWLEQEGSYKKSDLKKEIIEKTQRCFREMLNINRPLRWMHYTDSSIFDLKRDSYAQCWAGIRDINTLALASGLKGLVILFDEFEDVLYNLERINYKETAFQNLFLFFQSEVFLGLSFFAVTPGFIDECKRQLLSKDCWNQSYTWFDRLPTFSISPLEEEHLTELADKIREFHGIAYEWNTNTVQVSNQIRDIVKRTSSLKSQDRTRFTICETIKALDYLLED